MKNLAGVKDCDIEITKELSLASIPIVDVHRDFSTEVPYTKIGKLGDFVFHRCWIYWRVEGKMPLHIAEKIYNDPACHGDVRAGCHCGAIPPSKISVKMILNTDIIVIPDSEYIKCKDMGITDDIMNDIMSKYTCESRVKFEDLKCEEYVLKYDIDTILACLMVRSPLPLGRG